jgi:hypothetical protein
MLFCRRFFYRREYLHIHLRCTHHLDEEEAKDKSVRSMFEYVYHDDLDPIRGVRKDNVATSSNQDRVINVNDKKNIMPQAGPSTSKQARSETRVEDRQKMPYKSTK